ncbi:hypothetical protein [Tessaracoccus sp. MC1756]|uniref:hypothetical protein n=1 Tax=Tessaracoccus sp. MC1756 TaxID=2760311 RepID=UPI00160061E4|nr:hypothetical protein [Tessaracoccus sp. MC1756]MBB1509904.1 hypothetical protein [Tessaracoccus sp. MC1756]
MQETVITDESGAIEITVEGLEVVSLRISASWRDRFIPRELAETISALVRRALPPLEAAAPSPLPEVHLPLSSIPSYLAEMRAGRAAMRRYLARLRAGEVDRRRDEVLGTPHDRVEVFLTAGRFHGLQINPEWAAKASLQALADEILEVLPKPLVQPSAEDADIADANSHYAAARRYLVEK